MLGMNRAIAILTAWTEAKSGDSDELFWREMMANVDEGTKGEVEMTLGLFKLAAVLLVRLAACEERPTAEILQDVAVKYTL